MPAANRNNRSTIIVFLRLECNFTKGSMLSGEGVLSYLNGKHHTVSDMITLHALVFYYTIYHNLVKEVYVSFKY